MATPAFGLLCDMLFCAIAKRPPDTPRTVVDFERPARKKPERVIDAAYITGPIRMCWHRCGACWPLMSTCLRLRHQSSRTGALHLGRMGKRYERCRGLCLPLPLDTGGQLLQTGYVPGLPEVGTCWVL